MLDENLKAQLKSHFANLTQPVALTAALDDSAKSAELTDLLEQLAGLSDTVTFATDADSDVRRPSFTVGPADETGRIRFAGIPMGHEFTSLVLAILNAGGVAPKQSPEVIEQIKNLDGEYRFETFISLSCQNCPDVVQALNLMALVNPNIHAEMIDGGVFTEEVEARKIMAVPTVHLNGEEFGAGRMSIAEILGKLDSGASDRAAAELNERDPYDMLIVGGGPAGAAAAIYAARKGIRTGVLAERFGGQVMDTLGIENFISVSATEGPKLVAAMEEHVKDYDVDLMLQQRASELDNDGVYHTVRTESGAELKARSLVLATGARWRELNIPGEAEYRNKGVAYCPHCDGPLFKGKRVAVIGGGNSGVEAAIDLAGIVGHVTLIEFMDSLKADEILQRALRALPNVEVILNAQTTEVVGNGEKVVGLQYKDRATEELVTVDLEGVFVQIGLLPNSEWLKSSDMELSRYGEVVIDDHAATSIPGVFAAGDVTTVPYKQIIIAMGEGSRASLAAFDYLIRTPVPEAETETPVQEAAA